MDFTKIHVDFTKIHVDFNEIHVDLMKSTWILTCEIHVDLVFEISVRIHVDFEKKIKSQIIQKSTWILVNPRGFVPFFFGSKSTWILINPRGFYEIHVDFNIKNDFS